MRKTLLIASLTMSALLICGDAFAQATGTPQPSPAPSSGTNSPQPNGNQNSNWFVGAQNAIAACYRNALEKLQEAANKVQGEYEKDILMCKPPSAQECMDKAARKRDDAMLPIQKKRIDATTTYNNDQAFLQNEQANNHTCTSGGCCSGGTGGPAVGPDGRDCGRQGAPQGWGSCTGFANVN